VFTHIHWDHIQWFSFFALAYQTGYPLTICGEHWPVEGIGKLLSGQMDGDYFPIPLAAMQAQLIFRETSSGFFSTKFAPPRSHCRIKAVRWDTGTRRRTQRSSWRPPVNWTRSL